ncbi:MAG: sigma-54-dependent transcriptional regulator [Thermodesulfobacteriota bacterium]
MGFEFDQVIIWSKNNIFRDLAASYFQEKGFESKPVLNGSEALTLCSKKNMNLVLAGIDKTVSDIDLVIKKIKSLDQKNKVIVFAGDSSVETAVKCIKNGAHDFLIMPDTKEDIRLACEKILTMESSFDSGEKEENSDLVIGDQRMKKVFALADQVALSRAPVFLSGESGTGKEVIAKYIHQKSQRTGPFIGVNCAALPETLLESSLFGHEKGAFTGAVSRKPGKFELADKGTLLLDEITEMPVYLQAKLLRVLQEGEVDRLGGTETVKIDVRVLAATNKDPGEAVAKGDFRTDLYHRINTIPVKIPPLRQRPDDIEKFSDFFIKKYNQIDARNVKGLTDKALQKLKTLKFPGNVRELENIIRRAVLICSSDLIEDHDIVTAEEFAGDGITSETTATEAIDFSPRPLKEMEKEVIFQTLNETEGNRTQAADLLGISVRTLRNKLNLYKSNMDLP